MNSAPNLVERNGRVDLVGAGPGDPGLITRRGFAILASADAVVYDYLVSARLLDAAPAGAERIAVGKRAGNAPWKQEEINDLLVRLAREGKRVVRLKGGDPFIFGRGGEEAEHLAAHGIPFRVVPGVTASSGASTHVGLPLTHREHASAVAFVTGHDDPDSVDSRLDWKALAQFPGTLVFYMALRRLRRICAAFIRDGMPDSTPAALIQSATLPSQRAALGTLATLPDLAAKMGIGSPAIMFVGAIAHRHPGLDWFERLPLFGRRIVVTRPREDLDRAAEDLETLGAEVLSAPLVEIKPLEDFQALDDAIVRLAEFDWLVFTSSNGVRRFMERLFSVGRDVRALGNVQLAAIGPSTAETLAEYHLRADVIPDSFRSEGLVEALKPRVEGRRVLLARADRGRTLLFDELRSIAAAVEQVAVYRNVDAETLPDSVVARLESGTVDWITLTSSAIAERLHALLPDSCRSRIGREILLASISPVTTSAAARLGLPVAVEATQHDWPGLVQAIISFPRADTPT